MEWTGQVYADKPTVAVQAYIEAPPERVWALVSDIHLMPELSSELQEVAWLDEAGGPGAGRRFLGRNAHPALGRWEFDQHDRGVRRAPAVRVGGGRPGAPVGGVAVHLAAGGTGTVLEQQAQLGPGPSGLSLAIEAMPDKEQKIVFVRLREFETGLKSNLAAIKERAERA